MIDVEGRKIGGDHFSLIAGPCTVESRDQTLTTAYAVAAAGASLFRGGAYKPRTSPYAFQGLGQGACDCSRRPRRRPGCRSSPS